jgi:nicotinate-nucleotide adenylyltransferase
MKMPAEDSTPTRGERFIAVYGGAFDPPHLGHVIIPALVYGLSAAEHVIVVPSFQHPFSKKMAPFEDRLQMCHAAFGAYGDLITVTDVERGISQGSEAVYSIDLLRNLAIQHPHWKLRLVLGADAYAQRALWKDFDLIEQSFAPLIIPRIGHLLSGDSNRFPAPPEIASREFRDAPGDPDIRRMIPRSVLDIISHRNLYLIEGKP